MNRTRRKKEWERQQTGWESSRRFEELDSESDIDEGVDVNYRSRDNVWEGSYTDDEYDEQDDMQIAMRDKEVVLVDRAMARIRRAQELGKDNVKLTPAESDALERKMAKDRAKGRKPIIETERLHPKKVARQSLPSTSTSRRASRSSLSQEDKTIDKPRSRKTSSQNLQQQQQLQLQQQRRRPLPDDPDWRPRSSSSAKVISYPTNPQEMYQYGYGQPPGNYHSRPTRHVSGPAEISYPRITPYSLNHPTHASQSDPALNRRTTISSSSNTNRRRDIDSGSDDEDDDKEEEDDDADQGVQVDVVPTSSAQGYEIVSRHQGVASGRVSQSATTLARRKGNRR